MKKYTNPELELVTPTPCDVISASPGTETTPKPDDDGIWDLNIQRKALALTKFATWASEVYFVKFTS